MALAFQKKSFAKQRPIEMQYPFGAGILARMTFQTTLATVTPITVLTDDGGYLQEQFHVYKTEGQGDVHLDRVPARTRPWLWPVAFQCLHRSPSLGKARRKVNHLHLCTMPLCHASPGFMSRPVVRTFLEESPSCLEDFRGCMFLFTLYLL